MSGGKFNYAQYHITEIIDGIERELERQGKERPKHEIYFDLEDYPDEKYYYTHTEEVQQEMRNAIKALKLAAVYAQRVDWYLSGDDGEESFLRRLKEELDKL